MNRASRRCAVMEQGARPHGKQLAAAALPILLWDTPPDGENFVFRLSQIKNGQSGPV